MGGRMKGKRMEGGGRRGEGWREVGEGEKEGGREVGSEGELHHVIASHEYIEHTHS